MTIKTVTSSVSKPLNLALTLGDPAGVGGEVILKALADSTLTQDCKITIFGSRSILAKTYYHLNTKGQQKLAHPEDLSIVDISTPDDFTFGQGNATTGTASFLYLQSAINAVLTGECDGIVTAPIAKSLWQAGGYNYPGQTEVLAQKAGVERFGMLFVGRSPYTGWTLRTLLATTHIPLAKVSTTLTPQLMTQKLELLMESLQKDFGIDNPKIAIAGLNPHSGEDGKLGKEEHEWLKPWLTQAKISYPNVELMGLIPPDTMWVKAGEAWYHDSNIPVPDAYLALYHDQGLIPVKLMAFEQAINTTIGLPFIRTSPDHGTAFDIAGLGVANANSMKEAIKLAIELTKNRKGVFDIRY
jgi:4-hydroxythreonine-4-phosphate dehydrogenase